MIFIPFTEGKIGCAVSGCDFEVGLNYNSLVQHCKTVHGWKDIPCSIDGCQFVAYNETTLARHRSLLHSIHNKIARAKEHMCTWKNCRTSFRFASLLVFHMNIHTNNLYHCSFCPYRAAHPVKLAFHYRIHYKMYNYKCEICERVFATNDYLLKHVRKMHDFEVATCPLCKLVGKKDSINCHLVYKHKVYSKWNKATNSFDVFQR